MDGRPGTVQPHDVVSRPALLTATPHAHLIRRSATPGRVPAPDRATLVLLERLIEDVIEALELWQSAGYDDCRWVWDYWTRCVPPRSGFDPPTRVRGAENAAGLHQALLQWQDAVIGALVENAWPPPRTTLQ